MPRVPRIYLRNLYWDERYSQGLIYSTNPSKIIIGPVYNFLKQHGFKKVLMIGGGYGKNAAFLARKAFSVTNSDVSKNAIKLGRKKYRELPNINFLNDDILKTKIKDNKYDAVICLYLLSLFTDKEIRIALRNIKRILRPSGLLICNFLSQDDYEYKLGMKVTKSTVLLDNKRQLVNFFTKKRATVLLRGNKFLISQIFKAIDTRFINILHKIAISKSWVAIALRP